MKKAPARKHISPIKKLFLFIPLLIVVIVGAVVGIKFATTALPDEKVYVAIEGEGKIIAFDSRKQKIVSNIDLSVKHEGGKLTFAPHNIQVSPDMKSVWVTANVSGHKDHSFRLVPFAGAHVDEEEGMGEPDEVIVIDPEKDKIVKRISISPEVHLAHVVITQDNAFAYVTAQKEGAVYKINAKTFAVEKKIAMPKGSEPHGLRIAPDNSVAYLAMLKGKSLGILDLKTDTFSEVSLKGEAVQTGVTPDGKFVLVSLYDSKKLAIYRPDTKKVSHIDLPQSAKGPIQMYPTPDSQFAYLADQGYYFNQPTSEWVYKIKPETAQVVKEIKAGKAPHGVVVSEDGKFVYVTNLLSGDVSIIGTETDQEIGRVTVGKEPNGISIWSKKK